MPFIALRRTDIPEGLLFIGDLQPNTSQRNAILDAPGQTKYARRPDNDTVATTGAGPITTNRKYQGVAAYLIDNVEDTQNGDIALTAARANAIALALIARLDAGQTITVANVNTAIQASTGGAVTLTGGDSTATLEELLDVLSGAVYVLPAGSTVEDAANDFAPRSGSFTHRRHTEASGSFNISVGEGKLATWSSSAYEYGGTTGAALTLYDDDGTLL